MKKTIVSALTTALVVGAASTTFAAANPFSDVPAGHWAYDAIAQLAADGVIEGYGDGTFRGDREITRYEMAQMIAKAMAKNPSGADKAMLDRLAAEFSEELNNLGVRVSNLEKHADMVKWNGKIEYTYTKETFENTYDNNRTKNNFKFRLEPQAEVNDHWTVNARLDADVELSKDNTDNVKLKRAWAQGDYKNFQVKFGKMALYTNEHGLIWDTEYSGLQASFGKDFKATLMGGRINQDTINATKYSNQLLNALAGNTDNSNFVDHSSFLGVNLQYDNGGRGFFGGAGYYRLKNDHFALISKNFDGDSANIWSVNAGYRFSDKASLWGAYAKNSKADTDWTGARRYRGDNAWQIEFDYGNYKPVNKGSWGAYIAYRKMGAGVSLAGTYDGVMQGTKGVEIGAQYAPFKNIGVLAKYFKGKEDFDNGGDASKLFGRIEFFF